MKTWNICTDGKPYSRVQTDRKASAEDAIKQWDRDMAWMRSALEGAFPGVVITATPYVSSRLDYYGSSRGG